MTKKLMLKWPKKPLKWIENKTLFYSIVFTWDLPAVHDEVRQKPIFGEWERVVVGGPATMLMPEFFNDLPWVERGLFYKGALQKHNLLATRTSKGCFRKCKFCAVPETEGKLIELSNWPNLPVLVDNNLLACSKKHFDKVIDKLKKWEAVDFNQGLDARLLTNYHANRFAELKSPKIRLALDNIKYIDGWIGAYKKLRKAGLPKKNIVSYSLIAFDTDPEECWKRCNFIESLNIDVMPMWYHELDALKKNIVTKNQNALGWTEFDRLEIMGYFYRHRSKKRIKYLKYEKTLDKPISPGLSL